MNASIRSIVDWERRALWLARATIAWNVVEGLVAMGFGWDDGSVALFGFGVDSWVEVGSAGVVYWKLTRATTGCATTRNDRERNGTVRRERTATRWISALLVALAAATAVGAVAQLGAGGHPATTVPAVVVSAVSLSFLGWLWGAKRRAATVLDSRTLAMDAACSLACIQLSVVLLAGSVAYLVAPALWWADAVAALVLAALIGREGRAGWRAASRADFAGGCGCH
jgi:divalent metal cation (Fe/Co/Zn/Cd) transporter